MSKPAMKSEIARLVGAFDASGKDDQGLTVVAGFISKKEDWVSFSTQWFGRLAKDKVEYFHMVEFAASRSQFEGWRDYEDRRQGLLADLVGIIHSHVYRKFGSVVYSSTFPMLSAENRREFGLNSYVLAARACVADAAIWQKEEGMSHVPTAYAFEAGDVGEAKLSERMLADGHSKPNFLPKKECAPLQAADLLAYEISKAVKDMEKGTIRKKFRWALEELEKIPGVVGEFRPQDISDLNRNLDQIRERTAPKN